MAGVRSRPLMTKMRLTKMFWGIVLLLALPQPADAGQWSKGDTIRLRWACPNIRGTQRAHAYFSRGPVSDRDAEAYLKRIGCYAGTGMLVELDAPLVPDLATGDGRPATIWRLLAEGRVMYGLVIDASGPHEERGFGEKIRDGTVAYTRQSGTPI